MQGGSPVGRLVRVARGSGVHTVLTSEGLNAPGGLAVADEASYVSNYSIFPGLGKVVRIPR